MAEKNFQRHTGEGKRDLGSSPGLGKVSRIPITPASGELLPGSRPSHLPALIGTGFIALLIVGSLVFILFGKNRKSPGVVPDIKPGSSSSSTAAPFLTTDQAAGIMIRALESRGLDSIPGLFKTDSGTAPEEILSTLNQIQSSEGSLVRIDWNGQKFLNGLTLVAMVSYRAKDGAESSRSANLVWGDDRKWRLDYDSYLRASSLPWEQILSGEPPSASTVRVFASQDNYYNGPYADDSIWQCYLLVSHDLPKPVYGYAKRGQPAAKALTNLLPNSTSRPLTLEVKAPPESVNRQVAIQGVAAEDWVLGPLRPDGNN